MSAIDGKTLASCFDMVIKVAEEIEALSDRLGIILNEALKRDDEVQFVVWDDKSCETWLYRADMEEWVWTDLAFNLPLKPKGSKKRHADRYVGFQISMTGDGIAIAGNSEPLLHVFSWSVPFDFNKERYIGFPWERGTDSDDGFEIQNARVMRWDESDEWNYSLRLLALNDESALQKYCVDPMIKLLKGVSVLDALPDSFLEEGVLLRLPRRAVLTGAEQTASA